MHRQMLTGAAPEVLRHEGFDLVLAAHDVLAPLGDDGRGVCRCQHDAPEKLVARLSRLPDGEYTHTDAAWEALGGRTEHRRA
ncbi:MAG: hypothetical protein M3203_02610 [Actinomycetota bacterium]|nr:hypothetical protein [Actinomycetota bacterium]